MKVVMIGGLSVNPERFLPFVEKHSVFMISESRARWKSLLDAGGPYAEIPEIKVKQIGKIQPDLIWSLLSPWDGLESTLEAMRLYPRVPVVRQSQGGMSPQRWLNDRKKGPSYDKTMFAKVLRGAKGIMVNSALYLQCLRELYPGVTEDVLVTNGMAANAEIVRTLLAPMSQPNCAVIGRPKANMRPIVDAKIHYYDHSTGREKNAYVRQSKYYHRGKYHGDVRFLRKKPISIRRLLTHKRRSWPQFSRYAAGVMHDITPRNMDMHRGVDINVPGRVNTYILCGIPPIVEDRESGMRELLSEHDFAILYKSKKELVDMLRDRSYMEERRRKTIACRHLFTAQHELERIEAFFSGIVGGNG